MKIITKSIALVLISFLIISCGSVNSLTKNLMQGGKVSQTSFKATVPFEYRLGLMVIKANFNGIEGTFMLDTGAPCTISPEFAKRLSLETVVTGTITDSGNHSANQDYIAIPKVTLGNATFENVGAVIIDLNSSESLSCLDIDGIVGANLMQLSIVEIDYEHQRVTFTDSKEKLMINPNANVLQFTKYNTGTPRVKITVVDAVIEELTFDTGSNGAFSLDKNAFNRLKERQLNPSMVYVIGNRSYGAFGKHAGDTLYRVKLDKIQLGKETLNNTIARYNSQKSLLGNKFLKNYKVIIDWKLNEITLQKVKQYDYTTINDFGFTIDIRKQKMFVAGIYANSSAQNQGLQTGDQIITLNGEDFESILASDICELILKAKKMLKFKGQNTVSLTVIRNQQHIDLVLKRTKIL